MQPVSPHQNPIDIKRLVLAFAISVGLMFGWSLLFPQPTPAPVTATKSTADVTDTLQVGTQSSEVAPLFTNKHAALAQAPRVKIDNGALHGSIPLTGKGLRLDDLTLANYHVAVDKSSPEVTLLSPASMEVPYFAEFGWTTPNRDVAVPGEHTVWQSNGATLTPSQPLELTWNNGQGLIFSITLALDEHYMFTVTRRVENTGFQPVQLLPYALINRAHEPSKNHLMVLHEGPFGVFNSQLEEVDYDDIKDKGTQEFASTGGWSGIGDKYWFTAIIPDQSASTTTRMRHYTKRDANRYQLDVANELVTVAVGDVAEHSERFYGGPKKVTLLDAYEIGENSTQPIPLFDRAVDFGILYFLTKPFFYALQYFYNLVGNFGIGIMLLTICVRLVLFPLANKSYKAMALMRNLQPKMQEIREKHKDDPMKMNQEIMGMYKREKVNPAAGCLPILVQIPIFFALYKVLLVTIEMRHAPFYGWIHDLSAPDPTSVFTLFGLIPIDLPVFLHIGIWPVIMMITMVIQQKLNPAPADPMQAKILKLLPYMFLFLFASFPAGLVIYWSWNNTLSVLQQWLIIKRHGKPEVAKVSQETPAKEAGKKSKKSKG